MPGPRQAPEVGPAKTPSLRSIGRRNVKDIKVPPASSASSMVVKTFRGRGSERAVMEEGDRVPDLPRKPFRRAKRKLPGARPAERSRRNYRNTVWIRRRDFEHGAPLPRGPPCGAEQSIDEKEGDEGKEKTAPRQWRGRKGKERQVVCGGRDIRDAGSCSERGNMRALRHWSPVPHDGPGLEAPRP